MHRLRAHQEADEVRDHVRRTAAVLPQVENRRIGARQERHCGAGGVAGDLRRHEPAQIQIADIAGESFDAHEAEVAASGREALALVERQRQTIGGRARRRSWPLSHWVHADAEMLVAADLAQVVGQALRKLAAVRDGVVFAALLSRAKGLRHLLGYVRKHVAVVQGFQRALYHLRTRRGIDANLGCLLRLRCHGERRERREHGGDRENTESDHLSSSSTHERDRFYYLVVGLVKAT